jgi:hypothetical protein
MIMNEVSAQLNALTPPGIRCLVLYSLVKEAEQVIQKLFVIIACSLDRALSVSGSDAVVLDWLWTGASILHVPRHAGGFSEARLQAEEFLCKLYQPTHEV